MKTILAFLTCLACTPAYAQGHCAPRDQVAAQLSQKYREYPRAMGLAADGKAVVDVFASDGGS
jgi:hypothetical protein